jgi:hypothetical protein
VIVETATPSSSRAATTARASPRPAHDLYYLNVLAGPGEPSLAFSDDPAHHWLREAWADMDTDPAPPDDPREDPAMTTSDRDTAAHPLDRRAAPTTAPPSASAT